MIVGIPKEILERESRVAALPGEVRSYVEMGFSVLVEAGAGEGSLAGDDQYRQAGAEIVADVADLYARADVVLKVKQPEHNRTAGANEIEMMREGATLITFLHPAAPASHANVEMLRRRNITAFTMDGIPRIPRAQVMDALTSMSTITGYKSVLMAAGTYPRFVPMIGTAIGATKPARFLIVGAGVVGLQAIATARRLGGTVQAVDIRAEARAEAESLNARIAGFDVPPELAVAEGGYAKPLPQEWIIREREALAPLLAAADIVITSALVPGEVAPVLVTDEMVAGMQPGSVIVDVAVDQGGNCAATQPGEQRVRHGVHILGVMNIPGSVPVHASWLYAQNMLEFVKNAFKGGVTPDLQDEIVRSSLVTHQGTIYHQGYLHATAGS